MIFCVCFKFYEAISRSNFAAPLALEAYCMTSYYKMVGRKFGDLLVNISAVLSREISVAREKTPIFTANIFTGWRLLFVSGKNNVEHQLYCADIVTWYNLLSEKSTMSQKAILFT